MSRSSGPTVLVIQNGRSGGPRRFAEWLQGAGLQLEVIHGWDGQQPPAQLTHDGLIVLGGGYLPDEDDRAPWLAATRSLAEQALAAEVPFFGICLGGQLLAHIAGGTVQGKIGPGEYGSTEIRFCAAAKTDPLFGALDDSVQYGIEHHQDAITRLPEGAVLLASSERYPHQAFRVGEFAWGVQFHPETTPDRILTWDQKSLADKGFDREALFSAATAVDRSARSSWQSVALAFAQAVQRHHTKVAV